MQTDALNQLEQLAETLTLEYGLVPDQLMFLPAGEDGLLYTFLSGDRKYVAKIVGFRRGTDKQRLENTLRSLDQLAHTTSLGFIVSPIPKNDARFVCTFAGHSLVVYPFVEGTLQRQCRTTPQQYAELGRLVGALHHVDPDLYSLLERQTFNTKTADKLAPLLDQLPAFAAHAQLRPVYDLLRPLETRLRQDLKTYAQLGSKLRHDNHRPVIVHGDLSPGNIIFGSDGTIRIIDWEGIHIGMAEEDVMLFSDMHELPDFLAGYLAVDRYPLHSDAFIFFSMEWQLEGIVERVELLLQDGLHDAQRAHELDELADELAGHQWFDASMKRIREVLETHGYPAC